MSPIHPPHNNAVLEMIDWSIDVLPRLSARGPVGIAALDSESQPDVVWLRRRDSSVTRPEPADVLLVNEVADGSLDKDCDRKAQLYAEAGITDDWIVNILGRCVEVRREPQGSVYRVARVFDLPATPERTCCPSVGRSKWPYQRGSRRRIPST